MTIQVKKILGVVLFLAIAVMGSVLPAYAKDGVWVGYVQVAEGSSWRIANSRSIQEAADQAGIQLVPRKGSNIKEQKKEILYLINQGVDAIALAPVQADGWDDVLQDAKKEGIPVVIMDRAITSDKSLYLTYIGADMNEEGRKAANWIIKKFADKTGPVRIVELRGMEGATPAINRHNGFSEVISKNEKFLVTDSRAADFSTAKGKEVMADILKAENGVIDVIFAHNDDMALGAIEAIKEYGKKPGVDIIIISIDGMRTAFEAMAKGELNATIECLPLLGPYLMSAVQAHLSGKVLPDWIVTPGKLFEMSSAAEQLPLRKY